MKYYVQAFVSIIVSIITTAAFLASGVAFGWAGVHVFGREIGSGIGFLAWVITLGLFLGTYTYGNDLKKRDQRR